MCVEQVQNGNLARFFLVVIVYATEISGRGVRCTTDFGV